MKQRITIIKIAGPGATEIVNCFRVWQMARRKKDRSDICSKECSISTRREVDRIFKGICANASEPPVVFFSQYIDLWSMFDVFQQWTSPAGKNALAAMSDKVQMLCYALPDKGLLAKHLEKALHAKRAKPRRSDEERLFISTLLEAVHAWELVVRNSAIVVAREVLGPGPTDDEIHSAAKSIPSWLKKLRLDELRRDIAKGIEDVERGLVGEWDPEETKAKARARWEARRKTPSRCD